MVERRGKTVLVATNSLEEVERLAEHVLVLTKGEVAAHGRWAELRSGGQMGRKALLNLLKDDAEELREGKRADKP